MRSMIHPCLVVVMCAVSAVTADSDEGAGSEFGGSRSARESGVQAAPEAPIPDLTQTDPDGGFARGGKSFCGPVAVSNSLVGLFADRLNRSGISQHDLVNRLASPGYMNTHEVEGTGINGLLQGVRRCLEDWMIGGCSLEYRGWRPHRREFSTLVDQPMPEWIEAILAGGGAVWLNVGWYRISDSKGVQYERTGGHWVTAVGFRRPDAPEAPPIVLVHDPAPRAGAVPSREEVTLLALREGTLTGSARNLPRPAGGLYRMAGGMHLKKGADLAILDGAAALRWLHPGTAGTTDESSASPSHSNSP